MLVTIGATRGIVGFFKIYEMTGVSNLAMKGGRGLSTDYSTSTGCYPTSTNAPAPTAHNNYSNDNNNNHDHNNDCPPNTYYHKGTFVMFFRVLASI